MNKIQNLDDVRTRRPHFVRKRGWLSVVVLVGFLSVFSNVGTLFAHQGNRALAVIWDHQGNSINVSYRAAVR